MLLSRYDLRMRIPPIVLLVYLLAAPGCDLLNPPQTDLDADGFAADEDCDDRDPQRFPGAGERCDDKDNDCDGVIDEGFDEDGDGRRTCGACADCDDADPAVFPGAIEVCNGVDDDCDGVVDNGTGGATDADGDGVSGCDGDCDDGDAAVFPGATELCDGIDNDCDGLLADIEGDADGDGASGCPGDDCDDTDPAVYPGAPEVCDGDDEDCDGLIDEAFDLDGDGVSSCDLPPDCDDGDALTFPGAPEQCDGVDNDCDGQVDEDTSGDGDGDGVGACAGDCNDGDPTVYPGGFEHPNGRDDDCDGQIDEGWSGTGSADLLDPVALGAATLELRGNRLSRSGDVNGDGRTDLVVGSPTYNSGAGRAWLYLGQGFSVVNPPATLTALATVSGAAGDALGESVALADLDGDGYDDVIIGKPQSSSASPPAGAVHVFWGSPILTGGTWPVAAAGVRIVGTQSTEQCGTGVANAGDVNGDGRDDLLVGCPWYDPGGASTGLRGRTLLFFGRTRAQWASVDDAADASSKWVGTTAETMTGEVLAGIGDHNGDGFADFAIGSPEHTGGNGRLCVVLGGPTGNFAASYTLDQASRCWTGVAGQRVGSSVAGGHGDSDAYGDVVVGGPASNAGRGFAAYLIGGPAPWSSGPLSTRWSFIVFGGAPNDAVGTSVALVDLNDDGVDELVVATPGWDGPAGADQGRASIFASPMTQYTGVVDPSSATAKVLGAAQGDALGSTMAAQADVNGDGSPDLFVGAPWNDDGAAGGGAIYFLPGAP